MGFIKNTIDYSKTFPEWNQELNEEKHRYFDDTKDLKGLPGIYKFFYHGPHPFYELHARNGFALYVGVTDDLGKRITSEHTGSFTTSTNLLLEHMTFKWASPTDGNKNGFRDFEDWVALEEYLIWNLKMEGLGQSPCMGRVKAFHSLWDWFHCREKWRKSFMRDDVLQPPVPAPSHIYNVRQVITEIRSHYLSLGYDVKYTVDQIVETLYTSPTVNEKTPKVFLEE